MLVFPWVGTDGSSAGGQLAGGQHNAENGPALFLCTLAPMQWQVSVTELLTVLFQRVHICRPQRQGCC